MHTLSTILYILVFALFKIKKKYLFTNKKVQNKAREKIIVPH